MHTQPNTGADLNGGLWSIAFSLMSSGKKSMSLFHGRKQVADQIIKNSNAHMINVRTMVVSMVYLVKYICSPGMLVIPYH